MSKAEGWSKINDGEQRFALLLTNAHGRVSDVARALERSEDVATEARRGAVAFHALAHSSRMIFTGGQDVIQASNRSLLRGSRDEFTALGSTLPHGQLHMAFTDMGDGFARLARHFGGSHSEDKEILAEAKETSDTFVEWRRSKGW